uniref:Uncharacterized protein n=1 Tax=Arundo donax TaxID=35708 RepID=A0A0A9HFK8_ARUDO
MQPRSCHKICQRVHLLRLVMPHEILLGGLV